MGATNVKLVYAHWGHLAHAPHRLLAYMALVCRDGETPTYWGGWEALAVGLGRMVPPESGDADTKAQRRAALRAVQSCLTILKNCGALEIAKPAAPGRHAVYHLILKRRTLHPERAPLPVDNPDSLHAERAPSDDERCTLSGTNGARSAWPTVHAQRAPEEEVGRVEEEITTGPSHSAGPRGAEPGDDHSSSPRPRIHAVRECRNCGAVLDPDGSCFACRTPQTA